MAQEDIQGALEVLQRQGLGLWPIHRIGQPGLVASQRGGGTGEPVGRHGEHGRIVGGVTAVLRPRLPPPRPDAQLFPSSAGGVEHPGRIDGLAGVEADIRRDLAGRPIDAIVVGHAPDTLGPSAPGLRLDLVGTAERIADPRLRAPSCLMVVMFGELVVDGDRTVLASLSGRASVQAYA
jgi:hypothetical protein